MKIVICGFSRSGTTLFLQMLHASVSNFMVREFEKSYKSITEDNVISKRPNDIEFLPEMLNDSRVQPIVVIRDPRGILTSFHKSVPHNYFCSYDKIYFVPPSKLSPFEVSQYSLSYVYNIINKYKDHARLILIRYEDLIGNPCKVQKFLGEKLHLEYEDKFTNFHKYDLKNTRALNGVRAVDPSNKDKWRLPNHRQRIVEQFTKFPHLFDILIELGYEKDRVWFKQYKTKN